MSDLVFGLFTPKCFDVYFNQHDFLHVACFKAVLSKALGYAIILGSFILKLPQILKIIAAKSVAGLSPSGFYLEVLVFQASVVYNFLRGYPISTWGENAVILVQNCILVFLLWIYSDTPRTQQLVGVLGFVGIGAIMLNLPSEHLWILPSASIPASIMSRIPQVISNFKQGHTGQLAFVTLFLNLGGSAARLFTSLQETGDQVQMLGFLISVALNGMLVSQVLFYWRATDAAMAKEQATHDKKKKA
ncbi:mannose-P-dolichol utilization defect 1 protein [Thraustotheca clavata]|uniref:Mannose-P-dolichol utilization defect 1 protein homolog n=1 Tax=Thraustotheca clavata TaxID=74557 RepID=A0A1W0A6E8_9STRA|nr:mannose-P-dolichol utilization defect 1 protein [Thraustotheca clavata]